MTFEEILDQAIAMLQRRGRVSYRTLTLQFYLDEESLAAIKEELIEVHHLAVDHEGRMLVWAGEGRTTSVAPSPLPPQQALQQEDHPAQVTPLATPRSADAERRQLTVMFCDLVDSTVLSGQLDPEDLREVVQAYQDVCAKVVARFEGHIAQYLGDGLLVYFGYPQAHEDDAQRAVRAGLGIVEALGTLKTSLAQTKGITLAVRLGIHTGLVVVGAMGGGGRQEQLALGRTPNIAARIEGLAVPNTVAISNATYRLVQGYFQCQDLGAQALRGVTEPVQVYHVLGESGATSRLDATQPRGLTPLIGRESEVTLLLERWAQVKAGQGHVVLLTGEAGIGKSRLVQVLKDHVATDPHIRWECRSAEYYQNTALFPLVDLFQRLLRFEAHETSDAKWEKLEYALSQYRLPLKESIPLFAPLLSLPLPENQYPPLNLSPQRQRQKTLETIVAILLELAERQPVLFIVEDLHWTDPSTLEVIGFLLDQTPTASLLVLLTCRPYFQPAWHHRSYITEITVNRLSQPQIARMTTDLAGGKPLPGQVLAQITEKTDGVPLFVEEVTKAVRESGMLQDVDGHYELTGSFSTFAIPATLQDSLMARLDRLVTAKAVAQYAAVIGRQFSYELLQAVSQVDETRLQHELGRLVEAEIVYQRGVPTQATYTFKHALIQDAAYESLLKSTRQHYHQCIAQVLEGQFEETVAMQPELVAHHYTEAGLHVRAVEYWHKAGQGAMRRSANVEALAHLQHGLDVLRYLPETPERTQLELTLLLPLGTVLMSTKGYGDPEVEHAYARARHLCEQVGVASSLFPVLRGLCLFYAVRVEFQTAWALGEQLLSIAQRQHDSLLLVEAHRALGVISFWAAEMTAATIHFEQGVHWYTPEQHAALVALYGHDAGVACLSWSGWALWWLGYPEQALERHAAALSLARQHAHPFSLAFALNWATWLHHFRRDGIATHASAEAVIALATEQGFAMWRAHGTFLRGWSLSVQGQAAGLAEMRQGLTGHIKPPGNAS